MGSLVMRAGRAGGLIVRMEIGVAGNTGTRPVAGAVDRGWYCPKTRQWLVAWEFDRRDVGEGHIAGTDARLGNAKKVRCVCRDVEGPGPLLLKERSVALGKIASRPLPTAIGQHRTGWSSTKI